MSNNDSNDKAVAYWRANLTYLAILLTIWFVVSYGCGILFKDALDEMAGFPLGFWMAQNGAIYVFILLIGAYVVLMNRLDKAYGFDED